MRRYKKNGTIYILIILLLGITLGYAYLNTTLNINGTTNITSANWNIYWDNMVFGTNNVTDVTTPATIQTGFTEVIFNVNFKEPGDTYEFTVDAVNDGSIDAMISTFSKGVYAANGTTPKTLPDYLEYTVTYSDGIEIAQNQLLEAGDTETYKVRVHYKEDISASQLPSTADNYMFKFSVTYAQATSSGVEPHPKFIYTVNNYQTDGLVYLNQAFPTGIAQYNTPTEALTAIATGAGENVPFYLKHKLENNTVTESYVEFVITEDMAEQYMGMVPGTYTLRGEKTMESGVGYIIDSDSESQYYEENKEVIKTAFGYSTDPLRCDEQGTGRDANFGCGSGIYELDVYARADGKVGATNSNSVYCSVSELGRSSCSWNE